jgi:catechol 2,3-dioxygenase-like lactoylglutathione lyase family enzyme
MQQIAAIVVRSNHCDNQDGNCRRISGLRPAEEIPAMTTQTRNDSNGGRRVAPAKFAHAVLATKQFQPMVEWYCTVLSAEVVHQNAMLAFLTYDDEHHRIAIAAMPGLADKARHSVGLDHLAYTYANLGDLVFTYERLKRAGIMPAVTINHGPTTSMYYRDPDGNRVELQIDNFDTVEELKGFFQSDAMAQNPIGVNFNPDELARDYHAGVPEAELKKYHAEKGLDPETMRRLVGVTQ